MAKALIEWETLESDQIDDIMEGREIRPSSSDSNESSTSTDEPKNSGGKRRKAVVKPRMDRPASGEA
jgi:cell division protease FtsH